MSDKNSAPIGFFIHFTESALEKYISSCLSSRPDLSLTGVEGLTLCKIQESNGIVHAGEIMKKTFVSKATISLTLNSLTRKGLIEMKEAPSDKRCKIISITDKGNEVCDKLRDYFENINAVIEKDFSEEEKQQLYLLLEKVRKNVSQE